MSRLLSAWIACGAAMMATTAVFDSFVSHGRDASAFSRALIRSEPQFALSIMGYIGLAALMVLLYPRIVPAYRYSILSGFMFGAAVGIAWMLSVSLVLHGTYHVPANSLVARVAWSLVEQGCGGAVVGYAFSRWRSVKKTRPPGK